MMKALKTFAIAGLLASTATMAVMADDLPPVPATPAPVYDLISAQPFVLDQTYHHNWRKDGPEVKAGYILVLSVNPDLAYPRNNLMPVLYAGSTTLEPINHGHES